MYSHSVQVEEKLKDIGYNFYTDASIILNASFVDDKVVGLLDDLCVNQRKYLDQLAKIIIELLNDKRSS